jgi:hypothetical protein
MAKFLQENGKIVDNPVHWKDQQQQTYINDLVVTTYTQDDDGDLRHFRNIDIGDIDTEGGTTSVVKPGSNWRYKIEMEHKPSTTGGKIIYLGNGIYDDQTFAAPTTIIKVKEFPPGLGYDEWRDPLHVFNYSSNPDSDLSNTSSNWVHDNSFILSLGVPKELIKDDFWKSPFNFTPKKLSSLVGESTKEVDLGSKDVGIETPDSTPPSIPEPTPNIDKDSDQNIKNNSKINVFSELFDVINVFDDLVDLDDSLSGTFKLTRKTNRKGVANIKATFVFKDEILQKLDSKKVSFKDKSSNSLFGDFGDVDQIGNPRTVKSGNKKFDYLYNGEDSDTLSKGDIAESSKKLVELSIVPEFVNNFESQKVKAKGNFRVNLDDNFIALATGKRDQFVDNLILRADFEPAFNLLNPTFESLA